MAVLNELINFWQNFLYGGTGIDGDGFTDTAFSASLENWIVTGTNWNNTPLGNSFQEFIYQFFMRLPHMLAFLTLALAVFLFCFMMYKIIKLFTSAF